MKRIGLILVLFAAIVTAAPVLSWIAPYAVNQSVEKLRQEKVLNGLSHIALQFWVPQGSSVVKGKYEAEGQFNDDKIREIRDIARAKGVKTLLCVYNGENGWDWNLAVTAMNSKEAFAQSLIDEMNRLDLDGIEIDLEGPNVGGDGTVLIEFIRTLSAKLKPLDKDLTLASFHSEYHTPGPRHWDALLPLVDGITTMGYAEIGKNGSTNLDASIFQAKYAQQKALASAAPEKFMIGMPSHMGTWQGNSAQQQVDWVKNDGVVGIAMWDIQLQAAAWNTDLIWETIAEIRGPLSTTYPITASAGIGGTIDPAGTVQVDSAAAKSFTFTPDEWFIIDDVIVDGVSQGAVPNYTFPKVEGEHTIEVTFKKDPDAPDLYIISTKAHGDGLVSPVGSRTVASGGSASITVTPDEGFVVDYVNINGVKRGPVVSADFTNIRADHSFEVFFKEATGGDLGMYEPWEPKHYMAGEVVAHEGRLWRSKWQIQATEYPGITGVSYTPGWEDIGEFNATPDTLITADLQYRSAENGKDTLIIKTDSLSNGTLYGTSTETIVLGGTAIHDAPVVQGKSGIALLQNGLSFSLKESGSAKIQLFDLRGRELFTASQLVSAGAVNSTGINPSLFSNGIYLMKISSGRESLVQRIHW